LLTLVHTHFIFEVNFNFHKQQVLKLNSLRTEKTYMVIKINDLEERLLER
jgi:hypothetical protein